MSSSSHPDKWIVPGGGMEPKEDPSVAAVREVCEEVCVFKTCWFRTGVGNVGSGVPLSCRF